MCLVVGRGVSAAGATVPAGNAQRLVFLLEYVGSDYRGAVRDGKVVNASEYDQVLRYTKQLIREYGLRRGRPDPVATGLQELEQLIVQRAPSAVVFAATRRVLPGLMRAVGDKVRPVTLPNIAAGRRLWANDCAPCHGVTGAGDGPSASGLQPPPPALRGEYLERLPPRQVYDAVSLGVDGTAMPSFAAAYTDPQRWDVAFFVMTLRVGFEPSRPPAGPRFTLDEIAASSNAELLARLRRARPDASPGEVDYLRVNFVSARGGAAPLADPDVTGGAAIALQMQEAFARVADRVFPRVVGITGYVRDPDWTAEKLRAQRGEAWTVGNAELLRYRGFRPLPSGSGFRVDDEGYVLSRDHLVRDEHGEIAPLVEVELPDQTHVVAGVVGGEPTLDLAVLRIAEPGSAAAVPELVFGDSDRLQVGNWLIALGDPPGPEKVFTVGLVSAPAERQCYQEQMSATLVQSALTVPARGLGGPVVDILGNVVGMTVHQKGAPAAPASDDDHPATHILPINLVLNLLETLKVAQSHRSPWLGVSVLELPSLRKRLGLDAQSTTIPQTGLYIDDVFDPSPASRAGVRPGDFLLGLGGHPLGSVADFQKWLYVLGVGAHPELELVRDGRPLRMVTAIEVRPESATTR